MTFNAPQSGESGLIPAYAGRTVLRVVVSVEGEAHPRLRGADNVCVPGSSPLTRGGLSPDDVRVDVGGLIPAYAGRTARIQTKRILGRAHPRLRGADFLSGVVAVSADGTSPLTRGGPLDVA